MARQTFRDKDPGKCSVPGMSAVLRVPIVAIAPLRRRDFVPVHNWPELIDERRSEWPECVQGVGERVAPDIVLEQALSLAACPALKRPQQWQGDRKLQNPVRHLLKVCPPLGRQLERDTIRSREALRVQCFELRSRDRGLGTKNRRDGNQVRGEAESTPEQGMPGPARR